MSMVKTKTLEVRDLRKSYAGVEAVAGVSFDVETAEIFGLLGPNGAGKTTTIHMLVGAVEADGGEVRIDGEEDPTRAELKRRVGVCPQSLAIYEELTGEENLAFFGRLYGLGGAALAARVRWGLEFAGLQGRGRDRAGKYSGGMKRRLNLACALVHEPRLVFLDEPTVGVDPQSRNHIFDGIEQLRAAGSTVVYTTHYMEEAERLCDRVAIMDRGRILALDSVAGLVETHGGSSAVEAELRRPPEGMEPGEEQLRIETAEPLEAILELSSRGLDVKSLRIEGPSLESVFLRLTGRSLRD